jgi:ATP-dependent exoDNAse (exonuclease V) alpha subunit
LSGGRGRHDPITVVGHAATISAGEFVQASGAWINDRVRGIQFKASFLKATAPTTTEGIEKYLISGMIRGIGPVYARKLVRAFGEAVFDVIAQEPARLREVTGIGPKRAERIIAGWAEQQIIREIMLFLHANGVSTARAVRIYKTYGADAMQLISENPYRGDCRCCTMLRSRRQWESGWLIEHLRPAGDGRRYRAWPLTGLAVGGSGTAACDLATEFGEASGAREPRELP